MNVLGISLYLAGYYYPRISSYCPESPLSLRLTNEIERRSADIEDGLQRRDELAQEGAGRPLPEL